MTMQDYIALSEELVAAARPCFDAIDTSFVDSEMAGGEHFFAVDDALRAAVRENFALPADLIHRIRQWVGTGGDHHNERLRTLLDQVTITAAKAQ